MDNGFRIRNLREERNMSQTELAKKAGITRATIWKLETGDAGVTTTKTLLRIAKALEVPVEQLFFDRDV